MITKSVPEFKQRQTNICGGKEPKDYRNLENCSNRLKIRNLQGNTWDRNARQNVLESRGTTVDLYGIVTYVLFYAIFIPLPKSNYQEVLKYLQKQSMC